MSAIARLKEHPTGFWFVFWGELAERASFYGMRTILALYLVEVLGFANAGGAQVMSFFIAVTYVAPLLGGWLADRVLGRYRTILYFSVPYIAGHILLGGIETRWAMFVALGLLALGSGSIKPNTSTLMGQIYESQKKEALLTEAFSYFYAAINIGAAVSSLGLPLVRERFGYATALMIPAALMVVAFGAFAVGKRFYPKEDVRSQPKKTPAEKRAARQTLQRIAGIFLIIALFWFVYDQAASTWIYFANDHLDLTLFGDVHITADQVQGLNPVFIVVLTPLFNALWQFLKRRRGGVEVPDTKKMLLGFVIVIASMGTMAFAGFMAASGKPSVWWMIGATFVITLAELCISVVGLEFAYTRALPGTKSTVTAAFLLTVTVGDTLGGFFNRLYETVLSPGWFFLVQTGIVALAAVIFVQVARKFERDSEADASAAVAA